MLVGGPLVVLRVLHIWTIAYVSSMSISYNDFLLFFFLVCILPMYLWARYTFNDISKLLIIFFKELASLLPQS
jgi:hypothetical protein